MTATTRSQYRTTTAANTSRRVLSPASQAVARCAVRFAPSTSVINVTRAVRAGVRKVMKSSSKLRRKLSTNKVAPASKARTPATSQHRAANTPTPELKAAVETLARHWRAAAQAKENTCVHGGEAPSKPDDTFQHHFKPRRVVAGSADASQRANSSSPRRPREAWSSTWP